MPSEFEQLPQLNEVIREAEAAFSSWIQTTSPDNVQYEVSQTSGEVFTLHMLHNELRLMRLEMMRQGILTRHAMGQFAARLAHDISSGQGTGSSGTSTAGPIPKGDDTPVVDLVGENTEAPE